MNKFANDIKKERPFMRAYQLNKGDVIYLNDVAAYEVYRTNVIYLKQCISFENNIQVMVTEIEWSKKKWWQFWKKKKFLGCYVEVI